MSFNLLSWEVTDIFTNRDKWNMCITDKRNLWVNEWVSEWVIEWLLFNVNSTIFSHIMARTSSFSMRWWWGHFVLNTLNWIFIVLAYWNNSPMMEMLPHSDTLFWFCPNLLCSFWRCNKYQFHSLWFDAIGSRTHDLPHSRRAQETFDYLHCCGRFLKNNKRNPLYS